MKTQKRENKQNSRGRRDWWSVVLVLMTGAILCLSVSLVGCPAMWDDEQKDQNNQQVVLEEVEDPEKDLLEEKKSSSNKEEDFILKLNGDKEITIEKGEVFPDPGASLWDKKGKRALFKEPQIETKLECLVEGALSKEEKWETLQDWDNGPAIIPVTMPGKYRISYRYEGQILYRIVNVVEKKENTHQETGEEKIGGDIPPQAQLPEGICPPGIIPPLSIGGGNDEITGGEQEPPVIIEPGDEEEPGGENDNNKPKPPTGGDGEEEPEPPVKEEYFVVTFYDEDGITILDQIRVKKNGNAMTAVIPLKNGNAEWSYTFNGWDNPEALKNVNGNVSVKATYSSAKNKYTVTVLNEDGTVLETILVEYGSNAVGSVSPSKKETVDFIYTFIGWDDSSQLINVTGNRTVVAQYESQLKTKPGEGDTQNPGGAEGGGATDAPDEGNTTNPGGSGEGGENENLPGEGGTTNPGGTGEGGENENLPGEGGTTTPGGTGEGGENENLPGEGGTTTPGGTGEGGEKFSESASSSKDNNNVTLLEDVEEREESQIIIDSDDDLANTSEESGKKESLITEEKSATGEEVEQTSSQKEVQEELATSSLLSNIRNKVAKATLFQKNRFFPGSRNGFLGF